MHMLCCAVQRTKISLSFRACALTRETGLACTCPNTECRAQVRMGMRKEVWVREDFSVQTSPHQSALPAAEINSKMKRCILSCECPYCGLPSTTGRVPGAQGYFTARGVMRWLICPPPCQPVSSPAGLLCLDRLGNKVFVCPDMPSFAADASPHRGPFVTHLQPSARWSGAYASRITNTLINKSSNPISPAGTPPTPGFFGTLARRGRGCLTLSMSFGPSSSAAPQGSMSDSFRRVDLVTQNGSLPSARRLTSSLSRSWELRRRRCLAQWSISAAADGKVWAKSGYAIMDRSTNGFSSESARLSGNRPSSARGGGNFLCFFLLLVLPSLCFRR